MFCFMYICDRTDFVVSNNLWFDDLRAEEIGDRLNIAFSCDVVLCG